jgi:hypothetical protein
MSVAVDHRVPRIGGQSGQVAADEAVAAAGGPVRKLADRGHGDVQAGQVQAARDQRQVVAAVAAADSFQKLGLIPAVYRGVLRRACLVQQADQLVEARGQDNDESRWLRPGVPESMRDARGHEDSGTGRGDDLFVREPEAQRPGHHMPRLVIGVVDMKGRNLARQPFGRPVLYHQTRAPYS